MGHFWVRQNPKARQGKCGGVRRPCQDPWPSMLLADEVFTSTTSHHAFLARTCKKDNAGSADEAEPQANQNNAVQFL